MYCMTPLHDYNEQLVNVIELTSQQIGLYNFFSPQDILGISHCLSILRSNGHG